MADNPIPEELKSDHLFLLVGGNPLPNWVVARLLLRENGQIYLVHTTNTYVIAQNLATRFIEHGYKQPIYVDVKDGTDAREIYRTVASFVKSTRSDRVGYNYTGGTKVMAVHGYRASEIEQSSVGPTPIFSYLDAQSMEMFFDGAYPSVPIGTDDSVQLTIKDLFDIHYAKGWHWEVEPNRDPIGWQAAVELAKLHRSEADYRLWRNQLKKLQNKSNEDLSVQKLKEWDDILKPLARAIANGSQVDMTLQEVCDLPMWPFTKPTQLASWLEGKWLETYVLGLLKNNKERYQINDFGQGFQVRATGERFEVDVAATRGYQFHLFSCYSGDAKDRSKEHLFEAFMRATQIGGEEAGAVLICFIEDPLALEHDAELNWQAHRRIKVFGRRDLPDLADLLKDWFDPNIKSRRR